MTSNNYRHIMHISRRRVILTLGNIRLHCFLLRTLRLNHVMFCLQSHQYIVQHKKIKNGHTYVSQHPHFTIHKKGLLCKPSGENLLQIIHLSVSSTSLSSPVSLMGGGAAFLLILVTARPLFFFWWYDVNCTLISAKRCRYCIG